jgi:hypothetical protein
MKDFNLMSRRTAVKSTVFGLLTVSMPRIVYSKNIEQLPVANTKEGLFHRYPAIDDKIVAEVVGASHFNLERVTALVDARPELARATWDWGFGDWETAIGAASHVGRRDIAAYLLSKGARADIFTFAMLGAYAAVKTMIQAQPGIQSIAGPHGITLLQHANTGLRAEGLTNAQKKASEKLVAYLEKLGNADIRQTNIPMEEADKQKYLGDYKYGEGAEDGFTVRINMRKLLSLGKLGKNGGGLFRTAEHVFTYNGTPSVRVTFALEQGKVVSLTVQEPDLVLTAIKVS